MMNIIECVTDANISFHEHYVIILHTLHNI